MSEIVKPSSTSSTPIEGSQPPTQRVRTGPFIKGIHGLESHSTGESKKPVKKFSPRKPKEWEPPDIPIT